MTFNTSEKMMLRALVKTDLNKSKARKVEMYADADDNYSLDLYWEYRINELDNLLNKLKI